MFTKTENPFFQASVATHSQSSQGLLEVYLSLSKFLSLLISNSMTESSTVAEKHEKVTFDFVISGRAITPVVRIYIFSTRQPSIHWIISYFNNVGMQSYTVTRSPKKIHHFSLKYTLIRSQCDIYYSILICESKNGQW